MNTSEQLVEAFPAHAYAMDHAVVDAAAKQDRRYRDPGTAIFAEESSPTLQVALEDLFRKVTSRWHDPEQRLLPFQHRHYSVTEPELTAYEKRVKAAWQQAPEGESFPQMMQRFKDANDEEFLTVPQFPQRRRVSIHVAPKDVSGVARSGKDLEMYPSERIREMNFQRVEVDAQNWQGRPLTRPEYVQVVKEVPEPEASYVPGAAPHEALQAEVGDRSAATCKRFPKDRV